MKKLLEESRKYVIERAGDVWGLDYAVASDGLYPVNDKQFGRRPLCPQDLGLDSWVFSSPRPARMLRIVDTTIPLGAFVIIYGLRHYIPLRIRGVQFHQHNVALPYYHIPTPIWSSSQEFIDAEFEIPMEFAPKAPLSIDVFYSDRFSGGKFYFEILGEIIAKRQYLLNNFTPDIDIQSAIGTAAKSRDRKR